MADETALVSQEAEGVTEVVNGGEEAKVNEPGKSWRGAKDEEHHIPKNNLPLVFFALMSATFLAAMDQTIVGTALPTISRQFNGTSAQYSWVGAAYLLAASSIAPMTGKLSNCIGRKPVMYGAIFLFVIGSALCGAAQSMTWLCIARGVQGLGGGPILVMTQIIISDIVPLAKRGSYSGVMGACWGVAAVLGPLVGGVLTDHATWRWCFFINLPIGGLALVMLIFTLKLNPIKAMSLLELARTFDWIGLVIIVGGIVLLLVGFNYGESDWSSPKTIGLLVAGGVTLIGAGFWESYTSRSPIIPPRLFKTRTTAVILITVFIHSFAFISASYYYPLYFQIRGSSATFSGVELMPYSLGSAIVSIGGGFIITYLKRYKDVIIGSYILCALGYALCATLDEKSNRASEELYLLIAAIGVGSLFQAPIIAIQASMPLKDMATATATVSVLRQIGGTAGISVGGAIYASITRKGLAKIPGYNGLDVGISSDVKGLHLIEPLSTRTAVLHAYTRGVSTIWVVCAPLLFISVILSFFLKNYSLERTIVREEEKPVPVDTSAAKEESELEKALTDSEGRTDSPVAP